MLAEDFGRDVRNIISGQEYQQIFDTKLAEDNQAKGRWGTDRGGSYFAVGIGGALMGRGAHVLLVDDPFASMAEARSELERRNVWTWFSGTAYNRLEENGAIVVINHRMHEDDLSGMLRAQQAAGGDQWTVVELKAIDDYGDSLWPEKYNVQALERIRRNTTNADWSALYQQNPTPDEGTYFLSEWLRPYVKAPPLGVLKCYGASDFAVTENGGDWTVHLVVGVDPADHVWLLDMWRGQTGPDTWIEKYLDLVHEYHPLGWAEEKGQILLAVGAALTKRMRERRDFAARRQFGSRTDKQIRAQSIRARMALDGLFVPESASWYPQFRAELLTFPAGKHDDIVDALSLIGQIVDVMVGGREPEEPPEPKMISTQPGKTTVTLTELFDSCERPKKKTGRI